MIYTVNPIQPESLNAAIKPKDDLAFFLEQIGIQPLYYSRWLNNQEKDYLPAVRSGVLAPIQKGDVVINQIPTYVIPEIADGIIHMTQAKGAKIVALVHDVDYLRFPKTYGLAPGVNYLNMHDLVMVWSERLEHRLRETGVTKPIVVIGPCDYRQGFELRRPKFSRDLFYAGNLIAWKAAFLAKFPANLHLDVYGSNDESSDLSFKPAPSVTKHDSLPADELAMKLNHGFGLIWDAGSDGEFNEYSRLTMPHKFSLYMSLGLPVITITDSAAGDFVRKNQLGITVDSLEELPAKLASIDEAAYERIVDRIVPMAKLIRSGRHIQAAALKAVTLVQGYTMY